MTEPISKTSLTEDEEIDETKPWVTDNFEFIALKDAISSLFGIMAEAERTSDK